MTKLIPLSGGCYAIVDDEDFEIHGGKRWYCSSTARKKYAFRHENGKRVLLHKEIVKTDLQVDHRNNDSLDCRRENLREATHAQNLWNYGKQKNNTSGFKGVSWDKGKWHTKIMANGKRYWIASCGNAKDAAVYYNVAAQLFHGEFAYQNPL